MGLAKELKDAVQAIVRAQWSLRDGAVVPETDDLKLANDGVNLEVTILYADLHDSTHLVDSRKSTFAAELYKGFLYGASRIIRAEGGHIRGFDGDRVMGVFLDGAKNTAATRAGLRINYFVKKILNPAIQEFYTSALYEIKHTVGIDTSNMLVARSGIRGSNDLVWIGRAANYAAKLNGLSPDYPTSITHSVYDKMLDEAKYSDETNMWTRFRWTQMNDFIIYRSNWWWGVG